METITATAMVPNIIVADLIGKSFIARTHLMHQMFYLNTCLRQRTPPLPFLQSHICNQVLS